jgi:hypothetical protein
MRALLLMCLTAGYLGPFTSLQAGQWWETKNYQQWSDEEAKWVLNNSPWAATAPAGARQSPTVILDGSSPPTVHVTGNLAVKTTVAVPVLYRIRLFTARPIREASLRLLSLGQLVKATVGAKEITNTTSDPEQQASVDQLVPGNDKYIIIVIALTVRTYGSPVWIDTSEGDELSNIDFTKLMTNTKLTTNTGKTAIRS